MKNKIIITIAFISIMSTKVASAFATSTFRDYTAINFDAFVNYIKSLMTNFIGIFLGFLNLSKGDYIAIAIIGIIIGISFIAFKIKNTI